MTDYDSQQMPQVLDAINKIADSVYGTEQSDVKLGFMDLLWETARQESWVGAYPKEGAKDNINQITQIFIDDFKRLKGMAGNYTDTSKLNIQTDDEGNPDIKDPYTNFAMTAVGYLANTGGFKGYDVTNMNNRGKMWKQHHNKSGAGTPKKYMDTNKRGPRVLWKGSMLNSGVE